MKVRTKGALKIDTIDERVVQPLFGRQVATAPQKPLPPAAVIGELLALRREGQGALVMVPGQEAGAAARATVDLRPCDVGCQVLVVFEGGALVKPIIIGLLRDSGKRPRRSATALDVETDGERLVLTARRQLVLRCGKASITLTSVGKVLIQGEYVSSRSSGLNRVRGGSIQLN